MAWTAATLAVLIIIKAKKMSLWELGKTYLIKTSTLWALFGACIAIMYGFHLAASHWSLHVIDELYSPDAVRSALNQMTSEQRIIHAWLTATLDVAYPIALGGLLGGVALRFFPVYGGYLAIPALLAVPIDLSEGVVQILALTDTYDLLQLKTYVTPAKMGLDLVALMVAICAWAKWLIFRIKIIFGYKQPNTRERTN